MVSESTPPDALYPSVEYPRYAAWDARRSSVLRAALRSAAHLRLADLAEEHDPTKATELGVGVHCAILEPERFERRYVRALRRGKRSTRIDKAAAAAHALEQLADGREVLDDAQYDRCLAIRDALVRQPWRGALLDGPGVVELSALWSDDTTGVRCKTRADRVTLSYLRPGWSTPAPVVVELKSAEDASEEGFRRSIAKYAYHLQARMQLEGLGAHDSATWVDPGTLEPRPEQYVWLVLEKSAPYAAALYSPSSEMLEAAGMRLRHALALWAECTRSGHWPGYPGEPQLIDLPPWEYRRMDRPPQRDRHVGEPRLRHEERDTLVPREEPPDGHGSVDDLM